MGELPTNNPEQQDIPLALRHKERILNALEGIDPSLLEPQILLSLCDFLQENPDLTEDDISEVITVTDDAPLMRKNEVYDGVYVILEGATEVSLGKAVNDESNEDPVIRKAPKLMGEIASITHKRTATVKPIFTDDEKPVSYIKLQPKVYSRFAKEKMLPMLRQLVFERPVESAQDRAGKDYPEGLKPKSPEFEKKNNLFFKTLQSIAGLYTAEALQEASEDIKEDPELFQAYEIALLYQEAKENAVEANQPRWHEYGIWEHTRQVASAIFHLEKIDHNGVTEEFLKELKDESIDGMSKYDLLLLSLDVHDLGKAKPAVGRRNGDVFPTHQGHEKRSEDFIKRAMENKQGGNKADQLLYGLLHDQLALTDKQIEYIGRCAGLHFEFGKVRAKKGESFNMQFIESEEFADVCGEIIKKNEKPSGIADVEYQREIGLLFLLDTAGKTSKSSWEVEGVESGQLPTDKQLDVMRPIWEDKLREAGRPGLTDAYLSFHTSRATALRYLELLKEKGPEKV